MADIERVSRPMKIYDIGSFEGDLGWLNSLVPAMEWGMPAPRIVESEGWRNVSYGENGVLKGSK